MNFDPNEMVWNAEAQSWWPRFDHKPEAAYREVRQGVISLEPTLSLTKRKRTCVQAGGHVGLFAAKLARQFNTVVTFEPDPVSFGCLERNLSACTNVLKFNAGLGAKHDTQEMLHRGNGPGASKIDGKGNIPIRLMTVDHFGIIDLDLLVLDVEAYEVEVLTGAVDTIQRCSPVIQIELLPRARVRIDGWLRNMGYRYIQRTYRDSIYVR